MENQELNFGKLNNIYNYQKMRNDQLKNVNSSELKWQPS